MTITEERRDTARRATDPQGRPVRWARLSEQSIERRDAGEPIGFKGTAIVFDTWARIGSERWGFFERIAPEAVTKTLQEADVRFLQDHNMSRLLARTSNGTLRLTPDARGLQVDADMAPVSYAQDVATLLERGDLNQMSFAFEDVAWEYEERDGEDYYTITELRLFDVSVVTFPAYETTTAGLRGVAFDVLCRSAGLDGPSTRKLVRDLTDAPDPTGVEAVVGMLRQIAGPAPEDTTRADTNGESPEDTTTPESRTDLTVAHLERRHAMAEESIR